jgi:hypothetical protein
MSSESTKSSGFVLSSVKLAPERMISGISVRWKDSSRQHGNELIGALGVSGEERLLIGREGFRQ